jgi:hypothetical protein
MDALANLPEYQKQEFIRHLEDQQIRDSLKYVVKNECQQ